MATNEYQHDARYLEVTAPYAVSAGQGVKVGILFGVAMNDAAQGATVVIDTEGGHTITKTSAQAWAVGQGVYWNDGNRALTTTGTGGLHVGACIVAAANPSSSGTIKLKGIGAANQTDGSS
jgi:predicted RecA/RadA family phage recombinase